MKKLFIKYRVAIISCSLAGVFISCHTNDDYNFCKEDPNCVKCEEIWNGAPDYINVVKNYIPCSKSESVKNLILESFDNKSQHITIDGKEFGCTTAIFPNQILPILEKCQKGSSVLEIGGADTGLLTLLTGAEHLTVIDLSPEQLQKYEKAATYSFELNKQCKFIQGDANEKIKALHDEKKKFEAIICRNVIHFLGDEEMKKFLMILSEISNAGTMLHISTMYSFKVTPENEYLNGIQLSLEFKNEYGGNEIIDLPGIYIKSKTKTNKEGEEEMKKYQPLLNTFEFTGKEFSKKCLENKLEILNLENSELELLMNSLEFYLDEYQITADSLIGLNIKIFNAAKFPHPYRLIKLCNEHGFEIINIHVGGEVIKNLESLENLKLQEKEVPIAYNLIRK